MTKSGLASSQDLIMDHTELCIWLVCRTPSARLAFRRMPYAEALRGWSAGLLATTSLGGNSPFALSPFARQFASAANSFSFFAGFLFRRFFIKIPHFHFAEYAFALEFLFQRLQGLINIVIADEYLHASIPKFVMYG